MTDVTEKAIPVKTNDDGTAVATFIKGQQDEQQDVLKNGDQRLGRDTDDDAGEGTAGAGETATERSRSARRRERGKRAREAREDEVAQLRTGFHAQQQLLDTLMVGQGQQSLSMLEGEAEKAKSAYAEAERRYADAVDKGEGAAAAEAQRVMGNATTYYNNVALQHVNLTRKLSSMQPATGQPQQREQQGGKIAMTERGKELLENFLDKHTFIDLDKNDNVTIAIKAIEARLAAAGGNPNRQNYWDDLSDEIKDVMPHLFKGGSVQRNNDDGDDRRERRREDADDDGERRPRRRGGPPLGDGGRDSQVNRDDVRLNAKMVQALDEAGIPLTGGDTNMIKRRNNILKSWRENAPAER